MRRVIVDEFVSLDPPMLHTAEPNWQAGDTIPLGADRMLRVVEIRETTELDQNPVLGVEEDVMRGRQRA